MFQRLKDRIKQLCAKALSTTESPELNEVLKQLQDALHDVAALTQSWCTMGRMVVVTSFGRPFRSLLWPKRSRIMKKLMFATLGFILFTPSVFWAQDTATAPQEKQTKKSMSHTKIVTGCLQKGDEPGEFSITGKDGRTWGLRSSSVKLEQHVGHEVTVTGSAHREPKAQEKAEEKKEGQMENAAGKEENGHLSVTSLKMVSETCSK
jgi:hypothetical protein